jgi:RNA polymerase sigma-70 factor, ECF subfamily
LVTDRSSANNGSNVDDTQSPRVLTDAFDAVVDEHADYVRASLRRLGVRPEDSHDQMQEVFVAVHRSIGDFDRALPVRPWLFGFCRRIAANYRRLRHVRAQFDEIEVDSVQGRAPALDDALDARRAVALLYAALDVLSDEHREVFILSAIDQLSGPEIARALEIPLNTVYSRTRLARRALEGAMRELRAGGLP